MKTVLILILFTLLLPQLGSARTLEKIYAVVNGEIITLTEINDYRGKLKNGGFVNDLIFGDPEIRKKAIDSREFLIKKLIDEKIMDYEVKKNGFVVNDDRILKEISRIAKSRGASVAQMKQVLKSQNIKFADYEDFIRKSIERRQLVEKEISSKIKISEQDVKAFYTSKKGGISSRAFSYKISHILLKKSQKALAEKLATEARSKGNFEALVKAHTIDSDGKNSGGAFGDFKSGEMLSSVEEAIQPLDSGQTSSVVETPMGLHIFKLNKKTQTSSSSLEKERPQIQQFLFAKAFKDQLDFWLSQKRKDAIVQINKS